GFYPAIGGRLPLLPPGHSQTCENLRGHATKSDCDHVECTLTDRCTNSPVARGTSALATALGAAFDEFIVRTLDAKLSVADELPYRSPRTGACCHSTTCLAAEPRLLRCSIPINAASLDT